MNERGRPPARQLSPGLRDYLRREAVAADRGFELAEYLEREGIREFQSTLREEAERNSYDPEEAKGVHSTFLRSTEEDTRTWGNTSALNFTPAVGDVVAKVSTQLIHVSRRRPTTWTILTTLNLGNGWTGEGAWALVLSYTLGVGQANTTVLKPIAIAVPASGAQAVVNTDTVPAHAIQATATLRGVAVNGVLHETMLTMLAAPIYA